MITIPVADYKVGGDMETSAIFTFICPDGVRLFFPGDESTPEWQALHPPYESQEDESLNT